MQVGRDHALRIAREDALTAYRDLDAYDVTCEMQGEGWKIDYTPKDQRARGGGPHYVISGDSGDIVSKRYEQ
ncbi:hypothetical protein SAMN06893096_102196 [Geodermatophilus pulveris]|uniref:PepSY domain-containing protein n=1 Tax=Geodermatophilus pulveris TaxID=1564159 RepID=A0A239C1P9_9ACTN|nr:hypothetical protein SAMN06893096_102196 [Geodermatophilus pulveris]